jgi:hypothetical protein
MQRYKLPYLDLSCSITGGRGGLSTFFLNGVPGKVPDPGLYCVRSSRDGIFSISSTSYHLLGCLHKMYEKHDTELRVHKAFLMMNTRC